ncbi:FAD/NAD(P)-binding protein [Sphingomonas sp. PAMC 26605]|uniref:FAD/NAD(P)-binding protein n=1 Tax=Sphingomonas sp. PAMC 26605 TaxID=1112214 RepID=UPI000497E6F1|nr:FAD/NAD(P)-binding protein [Sphingomonas sp. PAMC 26605]
MIDHVAIVGAGFSGSLMAINLVRHDGPRATLIDRLAEPGTGLAYGAAHPEHLLNVRASNMSAFPDDPDHFVRWLDAQGIGAAADAFVPRLVYGDYLRALLEHAVRQSPGRLTVLRGDACDITEDAKSIRLANGDRVNADAAVLALGNLPPHPPSGVVVAAIGQNRYVGNCWSSGATDGLGPDDSVLVVGTGLTMVDVALSLEAKGFTGRIIALSRRGLVPLAHAPGPPWVRITERPTTQLSRLTSQLRARGAEIGWRNAIDELRPFTQDMWRAASDEDRARFIRHARPWWDIHRHRLAPQVAKRIAALRSSGRLQVLAGRIAGTEDGANGVTVHWTPRGKDAREQLLVQRIINCTGPQGDLLQANEPILQALVARGSIREDTGRLGIDVDAGMRTITAHGRVNDRLFALGPMTRGAFWEIVAVPDIRTQAWTLARHLSNAHWVTEGL